LRLFYRCSVRPASASPVPAVERERTIRRCANAGGCFRFHDVGTEWRVWSSGAGEWRPIDSSDPAATALAFAPDGDGVTDVFYGGGAAWRVSCGGATTWREIDTSRTTTHSLTFGDFDGDRIADVVGLVGGAWVVALGRTEPWPALATSSFPPGELRFGDL
jgi:hypothetical protein